MKRKIAVYGKGGMSKNLMQRISGKWKDSFEPCGLYMLEEDIPETGIMGIRELKNKIAAGQIHALLLPPLGKEIADIIEKHQMYFECPLFYAEPRVWYGTDEELHIRLIDYERPWLSVFEYHVNDHCNMNCRGCGHCSNLYEEPSFTSLEVYERDIKRIRELYDGVSLIRLLGGEPLMNPELYRFLYLTRDIFPEAQLHIVTNGILLLDMPDVLLNSIRNTGTVVDISVYPPMVPKMGQFRCFLEEKDIDYHISIADKFYRKFLPEGNGCKEEAFANCFSSENHLLSDGKIASCAMPFAIDKLNMIYGLGICESGWIEINDCNLDGFELNRRLKTPTGLCKYCSSKLEMYQWEQSVKENRSLDDWIYHEGHYDRQ